MLVQRAMAKATSNNVNTFWIAASKKECEMFPQQLAHMLRGFRRVPQIPGYQLSVNARLPPPDSPVAPDQSHSS